MLFREIELMVHKHLFIAFERSTPIDYDQRETCFVLLNNNFVQCLKLT